LICIQEVIGSTPISSTILKDLKMSGFENLKNGDERTIPQGEVRQCFKRVNRESGWDGLRSSRDRKIRQTRKE